MRRARCSRSGSPPPAVRTGHPRPRRGPPSCSSGPAAAGPRSAASRTRRARARARRLSDRTRRGARRVGAGGAVSLAGRRALVTGGTRGIGLATARALAAEGARVAVSWLRSADDAAAALAALSAQGATAHAVRADVGDPAAVRRMFAEAGDALGGSPDVLINNAAITEDGLLMMLADEAWERVIRTDLGGPALCCRLALRGMIAGRWGRIVNVVSPAAFLGQEGASNYAAAKAGPVALTKSLARQVARFGVTVNAVSPGLVETQLLATLPPARRQAME